MIIVNKNFGGTLTDGYLNSEEQLRELGNRTGGLAVL